MSDWIRRMLGWLRIERWLARGISPLSPSHAEQVARRAIQLLREAELDFHRCGQVVLARTYRDRATSLERELTPGSHAAQTAPLRALP